MGLNRYNIRVYGLCVNRSGQVMLTDERRNGFVMTKFPGGGHHIGEGLAECLIREFREELEIGIEVDELFFINDFLQVSAFNPQDQILSVYYWVHALEVPASAFSSQPFDFPAGSDDTQTFRWADPMMIQAEDLTFPIDRAVLRILQERILQKKCPTYERLSILSIL